jgi:NhaP-type Na+/H+ or K+/H+ antiporter
MWNAEAELLTFFAFTVVLGAVVFGGTTLGYFLDKRREDPPRLEPERSRSATAPEARRTDPKPDQLRSANARGQAYVAPGAPDR